MEFLEFWGQMTTSPLLFINRWHARRHWCIRPAVYQYHAKCE